MASLRRKYYTRRIPTGATPTTYKGKPAVRFSARDGKPIVAPLTADGTRCRVRAGSWVGRYTDADGEPREVSLSPNRAAAEMMLNGLLLKVQRQKAGIIDHYSEHRTTPLTKHLDAYYQHHGEVGNTAEQADLVHSRLKNVFDGCAFSCLQDLSADTAAEYLTKRRVPTENQKTMGAQTFNHYLSALKAFGNWAVKTKRIPENPFRFMTKLNTELDVRQNRRPLDADEFAKLIEAAKTGTTFAGITGVDRVALYFTAAAAGLRASELASLSRPSFNVHDDPPTVCVKAGYSKRRRVDLVPLHPELLSFLTSWLADKPANTLLWPGNWAKHKRAGKMLKRDLQRARVAWIQEGCDDLERAKRAKSDFLCYRNSENLVADFHALRHRFITDLVRAGVHPKDAKELARHSTITLTMDRYAHVGLRDTASALAKVSHRAPSITSKAMKQDASTGDQEGLNLPPNLPPTSDNSRLQLGVGEEGDTRKSRERSRTKQLKNKPKRAIEN